MAMSFDKFTAKAQEAVQRATTVAAEKSHQAIEPLHLLAALLAAVGVGASRMHEERHYLSDCLAGGLLGWWIGAFFARNLWLKQWWDALGVRLAPRKVGEAADAC